MEKEDINSVNDLFQRSLMFKDSKEYLHFWNFIGKILHYSHYNAMLVYAQNKNVQYFGTPGYWERNFGRKVNKDARPYVIMVPFGPAGFVYDVYETTGKLSPEAFITKGLNGGLYRIKGNIPKELYEGLKKSLREYKIEVYESHMRFNQAGETRNGTDGVIQIEISDCFSPEQAFACLIHELAHHFLGHLGNKILKKTSLVKSGENKGKQKTEIITITGRSPNADMCEIEAEAVSYLICARWNLESENEMEYISKHISEEIIEQIDVDFIVRVADKIEHYFLERYK